MYFYLNLRITCILLLGGMGLSAVTSIATAEQPTPKLSPWSKNAWYWQFDGQPILLLGGSDDDNLFQWPREMLLPQLDRLQNAGGNVIRNTMSDRHDKGFELYPFRQLPSGKYDLEQWNLDYWNRFGQMLKETAARDIFVQIEVWDRFDYTDNGGRNHWQRHPYNPKNNINYTYKTSGFAKRYPDHPGANKQAFFFTTPQQRDNQVVLRFQQRFVRKLMEMSLQYPHVLYCIDNETKGQEAWATYWAQFIQAEAAKAGRTVNVTEMWDDWNLTGEQHKRTLDHPELYSYVDVSQNNHNSGQKHWDNFLYVRNYLSQQPRPINTTKTYGADGNKFGHTDQDAVERFWRHLLGGVASARFHRPDSGIGLNDKAVNCIRAARLVEQRVRFWNVTPSNDLLLEREANEAYVAANPGQAYLVYFPNGGEIQLDLSKVQGEFHVEWVSIDAGERNSAGELTGGEPVELSPPDSGNWCAIMTR